SRLDVQGEGWSIRYEPVATTNNTAFAILQEASVALGFSLTYVPYEIPNGVFVTGINGSMNGDGGRYWQYWVDGTYGAVAADHQGLRDGDVVQWTFSVHSGGGRDVDLEGEGGRGPWRHADPDPRSLPDPGRRPRHVPDARVCKHRNRLRCEPVGWFPPGTMVDRPCATDGDGGPPASRMGDDLPRLRDRGDDGHHVLRGVRVRVRGIPRVSNPAEGPATREVRRPPHDNQRSDHDRLRPVDGVRRMGFSDPPLRRDPGHHARGPGALHAVPRAELPHFRPVVWERLPLPPRLRLAGSVGRSDVFQAAGATRASTAASFCETRSPSTSSCLSIVFDSARSRSRASPWVFNRFSRCSTAFALASNSAFAVSNRCSRCSRSSRARVTFPSSFCCASRRACCSAMRSFTSRPFVSAVFSAYLRRLIAFDLMSAASSSRFASEATCDSSSFARFAASI